MEPERNGMFSGPIKKVLWNVSVIHEKRLGVLDEHIENLLQNNNNNEDYKKELKTLNKKIDILANFRSEFNEYKKDIKNIKNTLSLQDSGDVNEKIEELNNNKLSTIVYLNNIKGMRKTIKGLKTKLNKLSNDYNILNLSHEQLKINYDNNNNDADDGDDEEENDDDEKLELTSKKASRDAAENAALAVNYTNGKSEQIDKLITTLVEEKTQGNTKIKLDVNEKKVGNSSDVNDKKETQSETNKQVDNRPDWLKYKIKKELGNN